MAETQLGEEADQVRPEAEDPGKAEGADVDASTERDACQEGKESNHVSKEGAQKQSFGFLWWKGLHGRPCGEQEKR